MPPIVFDFKAIKEAHDRLTGMKPSGRVFDSDGKLKPPADPREADWIEFWKKWNITPDSKPRASHYEIKQRPIIVDHVSLDFEPSVEEKAGADAFFGADYASGPDRIGIFIGTPSLPEESEKQVRVSDFANVEIQLMPIPPALWVEIAIGAALDDLAKTVGAAPRTVMEPDAEFRPRIRDAVRLKALR